MQRVWMSLGICAATLLLSLPAFASGFFVARFGGEHGHPTTDHLSSIYYNPAGLSLGKGTRLTIDANLAWRMFSYERPEDAIDNIFDDGASGTPREAVSANAGEATLNNFIAAPFAAVASDFGIEGFSAAVGFYAPFGGSSVYDKSEKFRDVPRRSRWTPAVVGNRRHHQKRLHYWGSCLSNKATPVVSWSWSQYC